MRDIKFRAWVNGKMVTPFLWINESNLPCNQCCGSPKAPLMQFIGILDKNGKEIYEGDIVQIVRLNGSSETYGKVEFVDGAWTVDQGWFIGYQIIGRCTPDILEVIGNIHENQELLK